MAVAAAFSFAVFCNAAVLAKSTKYVYRSAEAVPERPTVIVLGARVHANGSLSDMLGDRMKTALDLYRAGKASRFLLSGDHGRQEYDEVNAMRDFLLGEGVDKSVIFLDHAGFDTYDTMYRARDVFQVDSAVVVTQEFHLPRAVFIARSLGLDAVGVVADRQPYAGMDRNRRREFLARVKGCLNVWLRSKPKFLGEAIPITGDSQKSWDRP